MFGKWFARDATPVPAPAADPPPRDTDADWQKLGADEPYFNVLVDPRYLRANLTPETLAEFYATGEKTVARDLKRMRRRFAGFAPTSALDFGCGVGRLTAALAAVTGDALGIDISEGMLAEARKLDRPGLAFARELPDRTFDWIVSAIVFQHIPPERGYALLRDLLARLAPGGGVTLQLTIYRDADRADTPGGRLALGERIEALDTTDALRALPEGEMVMFDYDLSIVYALLVQAGIGEMALTPTDHGGFHGVMILGRKGG